MKGYGYVYFCGKIVYARNDRSIKNKYKCEYCGAEFLGRECDRRRGWARFCSKNCARAAYMEKQKEVKNAK